MVDEMEEDAMEEIDMEEIERIAAEGKKRKAEAPKKPRHPMDALASTMERLVQQMEVETASVAAETPCTAVPAENTESQLELVRARTRELELKIELQKMKASLD